MASECFSPSDADPIPSSVGRGRRALSGSDVVNLRWVVTHLLEETARHAGHADILRELIDGDTGR